MDPIRSRNPQDPETRRPRAGLPSRARIAARVMLFILLVTSPLALTQCRKVGDQLTGVDAGLFRRKNNDRCRKDCLDEYRDRSREEAALHRENVRDCDRDPACLDEEDARHLAALAAIKAQRDACLNGCHHQGGGTVGD